MCPSKRPHKLDPKNNPKWSVFLYIHIGESIQSQERTKTQTMHHICALAQRALRVQRAQCAQPSMNLYLCTSIIHLCLCLHPRLRSSLAHDYEFSLAKYLFFLNEGVATVRVQKRKTNSFIAPWSINCHLPFVINK